MSKYLEELWNPSRKIRRFSNELTINLLNNTIIDKFEEKEEMSASSILEELATACTVASLLISGYQIARHLANYNEPDVQLYIIRILMMIPVPPRIFTDVDLLHCHLAFHSVQ